LCNYNAVILGLHRNYTDREVPYRNNCIACDDNVCTVQGGLNKIPHWTICDISATSGPILQILEAA